MKPGAPPPDVASSSFDATTPISHPPDHGWRDRPRFAPGEVVGERYRIDRVAGTGGMGVVYEAHDLELGERIALKTIHPQDESERSIALLRREVQVARRVTHPNVCRIFDVGRHGAGDDATLFVTMEYLDGVTLSDYIRRSGRVQPAVAAEILRQVCDGVEAAHAAGVVHRDFKSANVMVVRRSGGSGLRAVITDFGLARTVTAFDDKASSGSGRIAGTPAYMAPEQIEGKDIGARADIYAIGVVAYEMVTGTLPFEGSIHALVRRLHEPAPSPRTHVPDLDRRWESVIMRCLERDQSQRYQRAADVIRDLERGDVARARRRLPVRLTALILVLLVVASLGAVLSVYERDESPSPAHPITVPRPAVAVLGFRNATSRPDVAWMSAAFAEMIATELGASGSLRLVPGEEVVHARRDLQLGDADGQSPTTLSRLRARLGTDLVVGGSYVATGGQLRLDLRVQDARSGETVQAFSADGPASDILGVVSRAGEQLRNRLAPRESIVTAWRHSTLPANLRAAQWYAEGVAAMRSWDARRAVEVLSNAVSADPKFALAHAELSDAWATLGYGSRALQSAKRAFELSSSLPRTERMLIEAKYRQESGELDRALSLLRTLSETFPDDSEMRVRLLSVLVDNSRGREARELVVAMKLQNSALSDPRIYLLDSSAAETLGDYEAMMRSAESALQFAREQRNRFVAAEAQVNRGGALVNLGKYDEAMKAFDDAEAIFADIGDRAGVAKTYRKRSYVMYRRGDFDEALRLNGQALATYEAIGQQQGIAASIGGTGVTLNQLGKHSEARAHFEKALAIYRKIGDRQNAAWAIGSIAGTWVMQNQIDAGIRTYEEALRLARQLGDENETAVVLANLGSTYASKGDLVEAERRLTESRALLVKAGDQSTTASVDAELGNVMYRRGDLAGARRYQDEALATRQSLGERAGVAASQRQLALIALEENNIPGALAFATAAASEFRMAEQPAEQARSLVLVALAQKRLADVGEAGRTIAQAVELLPKIEDPETTLYVQGVSAYLAAVGPREDAAALRTLRTLAMDRRRNGMVDTGFEIRLLFADALLQHDQKAEGRRVLAAIVTEAEGKQLGLFAARARRLLETAEAE